MNNITVSSITYLWQTRKPNKVCLVIWSSVGWNTVWMLVGRNTPILKEQRREEKCLINVICCLCDMIGGNFCKLNVKCA